jgi:hypothetical protein
VIESIGLFTLFCCFYFFGVGVGCLVGLFKKLESTCGHVLSVHYYPANTANKEKDLRVSILL